MKQDNIKYQRVDKGWDNMEMLLDEKMPKKKRRYPIWIFFLFGISACGFAIALLGEFGTMPYSKELLVEKTLQLDHDAISDISEFKDASKESLSVKINSVSDDDPNYEISKTEAETNSSKKINTNTKSVKIKSEAKSVDRSDDSSRYAKEIKSPLKTIIDAADVSNDIVLDEHQTKNNFLIADAKNIFDPEGFKPDYLINLPANINIESRYIKELNAIMNLNQSVSCKTCPPVLLDLSSSESILIIPTTKKLVFGLTAGWEHILDFGTSGYFTGIDISYRLSNRWSLNAYAGYNWHNRTTPQEDLLNLGSSGISNPENELDGELSNLDEKELAQERNILIKEYNDDLSSIRTSIGLSYNLSRKLRLMGGSGLEYYSKKVDIDRQLRLDPNALMNQFEWVASESNNLVPVAFAGLRLELPFNLSLAVDYNHAFADVERSDFTSLKTSKLRVGLGYSF